ncbi:MAG: dethiobiotin synthase [Crocinitomicaceae bacterium]|nr:dethiobiotin synthase [Crocinitomicaceae bacterium]
MSNSYFLTGIGTDVGKTVVSAILCELLQATYWKPIQSGDLQNSDSKKIQEWLNNTIEIIPEAHLFSEALSPHVASKIDSVSINPAMLNLPKTTGNLIVEGAGGWLVPINDAGITFADLAEQWNIAIILVSRHYLGSINHTLLSIESIRSRNVKIHGIIYVGEPLPDTCEIIEKISGVKTLFSVPIFDKVDTDTIKLFVKELVSNGILKLLV